MDGYLDAKRGLMADFDGLDCVNDKIYSMFPIVEAVDGRLYGVAVCRIKKDLNPGELEQLKEFCAEQFSFGWGEDLREYLCQAEQGYLRISFWQDSAASILTRAELETMKIPDHIPHQPKKNRGEHDSR